MSIFPDVAMTGDRPTGPLHLGHYAGSIRTRLDLQRRGVRQFVLVADLQALTDNAGRPAHVAANIREVVCDYLACGIEPERTAIVLQSSVPELAELAMLYLNLVGVGRLARNPTVKSEGEQKGYGDAMPAGFFCYPVSQAADITAFRATMVPVGADQLPMLELANEIVGRLNRLAGGTMLPRCAPVLSTAERLPGVDGMAKASKSLGNAIRIGAEADEVAAMVRGMYTDPGHLRVADPGRVEGNVVFAYLDAFDPDQAEVDRLKDAYRAGGLGDAAIKRRLVEVLEAAFGPVRERRRVFAADPAEVDRVVAKGTERGRAEAARTFDDIRQVFGMARRLSENRKVSAEPA